LDDVVKESVEIANRAQMALLPGKELAFSSVDVGNAVNLNINCQAMKILTLKVGARVMTLVNNSDYCNGSMGYVTAMARDRVSVLFDHSGEVIHIPAFHFTLPGIDGTEDSRLQVSVITAYTYRFRCCYHGH
jgi:hypothetical protein